MTTGIYCIENTKTGMIYVGQTSRGFGTRWQQHIAMLQKGIHHNAPLQVDWDKYGPCSFAFRILECLEDITALGSAELIWIERNQKTYNDAPQPRALAKRIIPNILKWHEINKEYCKRHGVESAEYPRLSDKRYGSKMIRRFIYQGRMYEVPFDFYPY